MKCPICAHLITDAELEVLLGMEANGPAACPGCLIWLVIGPPFVRLMTNEEIVALSDERFEELTVELPARAMAARL